MRRSPSRVHPAGRPAPASVTRARTSSSRSHCSGLRLIRAAGNTPSCSCRMWPRNRSIAASRRVSQPAAGGRALGGLVHHVFDHLVVGQQGRDVLGELVRERGEQSLLLHREVRREEGAERRGGDPGGRCVQGPRRELGVADVVQRPVVFVGQLLDGRNGLAAAVLAHGAHTVPPRRTAVIENSAARAATPASSSRPIA